MGGAVRRAADARGHAASRDTGVHFSGKLFHLFAGSVDGIVGDTVRIDRTIPPDSCRMRRFPVPRCDYAVAVVRRTAGAGRQQSEQLELALGGRRWSYLVTLTR